jgi:hypothetical protein
MFCFPNHQIENVMIMIQNQSHEFEILFSKAQRTYVARQQELSKQSIHIHRFPTTLRPPCLLLNRPEKSFYPRPCFVRQPQASHQPPQQPRPQRLVEIYHRCTELWGIDDALKRVWRRRGRQVWGKVRKEGGDQLGVGGEEWSEVGGGENVRE